MAKIPTEEMAEKAFLKNYKEYKNDISDPEQDYNFTKKQINTKLSAMLDSWGVGRKKCGSPIELLMLSELLFRVNGFDEFIFNKDPFPDKPDEIITVLTCQKVVGNYRPDFHIESRFRDVTQLLIVGCDGHKWHEKTKEQAKHDKRRDRYFTANGYHILRFTGSEVYGDAWECAQEVENLVAKKMMAAVDGRVK